MKNPLNLAIIALFLAFAGCKKDKHQKTASDEHEKITITHSLGTTQVNKNPQRVVALDFASLETLDQLGIKVIATPKTNMPNYLQKYKNDTSIEDIGTLKEINYEKLSELGADVIFMSARLQDSYQELSRIAPTIFTEIDYKNFMASLKTNFDSYAKIFDKKEETDQALKAIENKIVLVNEKSNQLDHKALVVLYNNGRFSAYGKGSRFGLIHDVLGIKEAAEGLEVARHGQAVSNEFIQQKNPDYLYIIDRSAVINNKATNKKEIENKLIQQTNAYKNGKVIYLNPQVWYLSGGGTISVNKMIDDIADNL